MGVNVRKLVRAFAGQDYWSLAWEHERLRLDANAAQGDDEFARATDYEYGFARVIANRLLDDARTRGFDEVRADAWNSYLPPHAVEMFADAYFAGKHEGVLASVKRAFGFPLV